MSDAVHMSSETATEGDTVRAYLSELESQCRLLVLPPLDESYFDEFARTIRKQCTTGLTMLPSQSRAVVPLRAIRAACRRFNSGSSTELADFFMALGEVRATIGAQVAILAALYDLALPAGLAAITPAVDQE